MEPEMFSSQVEISPGIFYQFKTKPFNHQREEWERSKDVEAFAILWEQGTGKSKLAIDTACWLWLQELIDGVLIVAPNGVHRNWVEQEIPDHLPDMAMDQSVAFHYRSQSSTTKWHKQALRDLLDYKGFAWLAVSYEAFVTQTCKRTLINFFDQRKLLYILDESHYIKSPSAARTKSILKSAKYAPYRRILTGTPVAQGPFDVYSQVQFLDERYWNREELSTFTEFKTHFGVFEKTYNPHLKKQYNEKKKVWERCEGGLVDVVIGYRRLDELRRLLKPISSRVTKDEVLDLPAKLYQKRFFPMGAEQAKIYKAMRDEFMVWLDMGGLDQDVIDYGMPEPAPSVCPTCHGQHELQLDGYIYQCPDCSRPEDILGHEGDTPVIALLALTRLLRLQQITCGYLPTDDEEEPMFTLPGVNRRLEILCEIAENAQHKLIVWARFQKDISLILWELEKRGIKAVRYDGLVNEDERAESKALFKGVRTVFEKGVMVGRVPVPEEEQAKVFVANPAAGATGLTLTEAKTVVYYSNSFKLIDRLQSEDRAHRIGQSNEVLYVDLIAEDSIDEKIVESLRNKFNVASQITGDSLREWL